MATDYFDACAAAMVSGAQEQFVAELTLRLARMLESGVANPDQLAQLARLSREEALAVWAEWESRVTDQCRAAFEEAVSDEDGNIVETLAEYSPGAVYSTAYGATVAAEAARGVGEILRRQNVALCDAAADAWYRIAADAVVRRESGEDMRSVMERACAAMADAGLETIDYKSGVRTSVDAALRRHAVTQANQARNDLLMRRCDEWGCDLVFTSAHFGARPTHAVWQGKVFSRSGSSPDYPDLVQATGYGTVTGLCGANCRHTMTPYVEGYSKLPDTDFSEQERLTGMTSDEYYEATQRQRRYEAAIRKTKREIAVGREMGYDMVDKRVLLGRQQARVRQWCSENGLRRDYERERAYGVGTQPRALKPGGLTVDKALGSNRVSRALKTMNVSKTDFKEALITEMSARGIPANGLADLPSDMANGIVGDVVAAFRNARGYRRLDKPDNIPHALAGANPRYGDNWRWMNNCQRCVAAYEMRRRGYDVEALPFPGSTDDLQYHTKKNGWPSLFEKSVVNLVVVGGIDGAGQLRDIRLLMSRYGDGARAVIRVKWKNEDRGHVFIAEQVDGETWLVDPQTGSIDCSSHLDRAQPGYTRLLRVDDAKLSPLIGKAVRNRRSR